MTSWLRTGASVLVVLGAIACGDSDGGGDEAGTGGTSGGSGGSGATGGTGGTTTDGGTSTGGMGAAAMCDTSIADMATCGSTTCPAMTAGACVVRCCVDADTCGFRDSTMGMTTDCVAAPEADPDCPDVSILGNTYTGCCKDNGVDCGYISPSMNACADDPLNGPSSANCDGTMDEDAGAP